jgi:hypothetical protein
MGWPQLSVWSPQTPAGQPVDSPHQIGFPQLSVWSPQTPTGQPVDWQGEHEHQALSNTYPMLEHSLSRPQQNGPWQPSVGA